MKKLYLLLVTAIPFFVQAQKVDSISYYSSEMNTYWKKNMDSLRNTAIYKALQERYEYHLKDSKEYSAFTMFFDVAHNDYRDFNKQLVAEGFPELQDFGLRFGFGMSHRMSRVMVDMYFITAGFNNKTTKGNETIKTSFSNAFQWDIGYDLLNAQKFSIYPYAGISYRWAMINYENKGEPNPNYTSISDIRINQTEYTLNSHRVGYQAGIGFDFTIAQDAKKTSKTILFLKAGMNRPVWQDAYRVKGAPNFKPNIKQGDWMLTIGIKFADKH